MLMKLSFPDCTRIAEKGSALFFILIGVALFAALSFAVAQMLRGGNVEVITEQKSRLYADQIMDYARAVRGATQDVQISNGCTDTEISFTVTGADGYQHVPAERDECKIFNADGGGITPQDKGPEATVWFFRGGTMIQDVGGSATAADNGELFIFLPVKSDAVCDAINKKLGLPLDIDAGTFAAMIASQSKFTGTYNGGGLIGTGGMGGVPEVGGKPAACLDYSGPANPPPDSLFYQAVLAR